MNIKVTDYNRGRRTLWISLILILLFATYTIITYNQKLDHSFSSLNAAVEKQSKGGEIDEIYEYKDGVFVFIKNSSKKKIGYYYEENNRWYSKSMLSKRYHIDNYEIQTFYEKKSGDYFIKVETENPIQNLTDSISTDFKKIILSDAKEIYIGGNAKDIKSDYTLKIDGKEYILNNYQKKKNILQ